MSIKFISDVKEKRSRGTGASPDLPVIVNAVPVWTGGRSPPKEDPVREPTRANGC